jgi:Enzyme involved in the deoxyxylulose pathway of isoprenoid biosynthesis
VDGSPVPLVADIHFDYRLAVRSIENGIAKVRINPGNIGGEANVRILADCLKQYNIPVRIGVNSGSIEKELLQKYGGVTPEGMVESGLNHARMLEKCGYDNIVLSYKATDVRKMVEACRLAAKVSDYPQHIGVTESGTADVGIVKSAVGIGALFAGRHRRHHSRVALGRSRAGSARGSEHIARLRTAPKFCGNYFLPDLRTHLHSRGGNRQPRAP